MCCQIKFLTRATVVSPSLDRLIQFLWLQKLYNVSVCCWLRNNRRDFISHIRVLFHCLHCCWEFAVSTWSRVWREISLFSSGNIFDMTFKRYIRFVLFFPYSIVPWMYLRGRKLLLSFIKMKEFVFSKYWTNSVLVWLFFVSGYTLPRMNSTNLKGRKGERRKKTCKEKKSRTKSELLPAKEVVWQI